MSSFTRQHPTPSQEELSQFEKRMTARLKSKRSARLATQAFKNGAKFVDYSERERLSTPEDKFLWEVRNGQLATYRSRFEFACKLGVDFSKFDKATLDSLQLGIFS